MSSNESPSSRPTVLEKALEQIKLAGSNSSSIEQLEEKYKNLEFKVTQALSDRNIVFISFGVFASIIAFFSVEFQILKSVYGVTSLVGLSLILLSSTLSFNLVLYFLFISQTSTDSASNISESKANSAQSLAYFLRWFLPLIFVGGIVLVLVGDNSNFSESALYLKLKSQLVQDSIMYKEPLQSVEAKLTSHIVSLNKTISSQSSQIASLTAKLDSLSGYVARDSLR